MAKNVTVTPADGDIQFQNTSGTDAGRIAQDGDNLVITNAVGDILFGDTNADVYIGDGVNSVDVLFEQSGAIKADANSQGVTLTIGGAETDLQLYAPSMSNLSAQGSESTTLMINTNGEVGTRELGSMAFEATSSYLSTSDVVFVLAGNDIEAGDGISLAGGLSYNATTNTLSQTDNNTEYSVATTSANGLMSSTDKTKLDGIASGAEVNVQSDWNATSGDSFIQNKPTLGTASASAATDFVAVSGDTMTGDLTISQSDSTSPGYLLNLHNSSNTNGVTIRFSDTSTQNSQYGNITFYHQDTKSYGSGSAFILGTSETSTTILADGKLMYSEGIYSKPDSGTGAGTRKDSNWDTAYGWGNHASAGYLTSETYTGTVTSVTVGTGLDVSNGTTTPSITLDLSELTDMTANVNTSQDELILLDNGAERRKLFSEIFGSAAYSNTSAFAAASHNHDSSYPAKSDSYISLYSDSWGDTPEAKYIQINLPYNSGSGGSSYYVFDVFGFHDIRQMDSAVNYRVYAHIRSNGTEQNNVKIHVYALHENESDFFEFAYKINAGAATNFFIYAEHDYSGIEIFGLPLEQGQFAELTSSMISSTETAPTGTTGVQRKVAHPRVGTVAGTYGNTANGTKIDTITIDEHGHVTAVATGATGNMTGFFVEDGDGTEVQINNANEWKFVEGTGIDINWTDTSTGNDSDPYDLTFAIKNNSIGIDQLNVSDGTNGQVLTTNGSGTLSFSTVTSGSSYGWTLGGTDIESGDEIALGGGLSLSGTGGSYTLTSANDNTTYTAGTGLTLTGTEFSVTANTYAAASHTHTLSDITDAGTAASSAATDFVAVSGDTMTGTLYLGNADSLAFESGKHWITYNDGEGNFNIRVGHKSDGTPNEVSTETGYAFHDEWSQSSGWREFNVSGTSITAGSDVGTWRRQMYYNYNDVQLAYQGSVKFQTTNTGITITGEIVTTGGNSTNWNTAYGWGNHASAGYLTAHPAVTEATTNLSNSGRTYIQSITLDSNGHVTGVSTGTETVTNTNTTYSAGTGLDLSGTTFSVEADLRDGITHVGKDSNNYIQFDSTNGRIDFYAGGVFVARMESDGDLHVKGDVIAFSSIFA